MSWGRWRRKVDGEIHGTAQGWTEMLVSLIESSKHLRATDFCRFGIHLHSQFLKSQ